MELSKVTGPRGRLRQEKDMLSGATSRKPHLLFCFGRCGRGISPEMGFR
jgi:hypothetical protein